MQNKFDFLWGGGIKKLNHDFLHGTLEMIVSGSESQHTVIFGCVSACLSIENPENTYVDKAYHEVSSIIVECGSVPLCDIPQKWLSYYKLGYNVVIEDTDSILLINAGYVTIDGEKTMICRKYCDFPTAKS